MIKKLLVLSVFTSLWFAGNSQILISIILGDKLNNGKIEFGLDGGLTFSTISGLDEAEYNNTFNLGFYFDIKTKHPKWLFHTGVMVKSTLGAESIPVYSLNNINLDSAFTGGSITRRLQYFDVPIMMKYKISKKVYVEGGIVAALGYGSIDEFTNQIINEDDLKYRKEIQEYITRLDGGLMFGCGYRLLGGNGMNIGVRYYYGVVDITVDDTLPNQYNRAFYANVGIPIGAGKPPEKPVE